MIELWSVCTVPTVPNNPPTPTLVRDHGSKWWPHVSCFTPSHLYYKYLSWIWQIIAGSHCQHSLSRNRQRSAHVASFAKFLLILSRDKLNSLWHKILPSARNCCGPDSPVGIAAGYGLDGPGSNPGGGEIFRTCPDRPWGPPSLLYNGHWVFPGGKERPGCYADPSPPSRVVVKKE